MSASREKKNRQGNQPMTEKQRLAQEQAATAKRNRIVYTGLGIVVAMAVIVLLVWDSGVIQKNAVAATIGGTDYTVADVSYYYNQTKNNFINTVEMYKQQLGYDPFGYDTSKSPAKQTYTTDEETGEVTTFADFFLQSSLDGMQRVAALTAAAEAEGYTLSEEAQKNLEDWDKQVDELAAQNSVSRKVILTSLYGSYVTEAQYEKNLYRGFLADDYQNAHQSGIDTSDSALTAYFEEHQDTLSSYSYHYAPMSGIPEAKTDADGKAIEATEEEKSAAMAAAKEQAEAMMAAVKAGEDFDTIAKDYVAEKDKDTYSTEGVTLRTGVLGSTLSTVFRDWMTDSARKEGDIQVFENNGNGYVVVQYLGRVRDDLSTVNVRHILVEPKSETEDATEFTDEEWAAAEEQAKTLLTQFMGGDKTAQSFGELAEEHSDDGRGTSGDLAAPGGLYSNVKPGDMVEAFDAWIYDDARKEGDTGLVKSEFGWHVMYFAGRNEPSWKISAKNALVSDTMTAWLEELVADYEVVEAAGLAHVK